MTTETPNFIADLVRMAEAVKMVPSLEGEVKSLTAGLETAKNVIACREGEAAELMAEIGALKALLRQTEEARDDAELRFLEAEERTEKALGFIKATFGNAGSLIQHLEPTPAPQIPAPIEAEPVVLTTTAPEAISEIEVLEALLPVDPTQASFDAPEETTSSPNVSTPSVTMESASSPSGSYATEQALNHDNPGNSYDGGAGGTAGSPLGSSFSAAQPSSAGFGGAGTPEPASGLFTGKLYMNVSGWVSREDWKRGGGSDATYDWRDGNPLPEGFTEADRYRR